MGIPALVQSGLGVLASTSYPQGCSFSVCPQQPQTEDSPRF